MLIRIEDKLIGTIEIGTPDNASVGKIVGAMVHAISLYSGRWDGRDRYDFLSVLSDGIKDLRDENDGPKNIV